MTTSAAIGIICKAPQPGRAKTRLATAIGMETAAGLSACFLRDVAAAIETVPENLRRKGYGIYAPAGAEEHLRRVLPPSFGLLLHSDAVLGNVLYGATRDLLAAGHDCVILVNGDSPTLPSVFLMNAMEWLRRPDDRMVLGPASDGGYYLIGLKNAHRHVFTDIAWGSSCVAERTRERAAQIGLETVLLPEWYDVDDAETFEWLCAELAGRLDRFKNGGAAAATRAYLVAMTRVAV
ncbi:MAG: TIGR04282 family arsenosugar biosynthesis glycosyltransferase [Rhizobiales bacterium]|nr:TIGR04282 family arsenosugar biosynthesis glycosyltransferase [Hyphomicrobiales bacterium]